MSATERRLWVRTDRNGRPFIQSGDLRRVYLQRDHRYRDGINPGELRRARLRVLRRELNYGHFEASRRGDRVHSSKQVLYVGWLDWCRLTRGVHPNKWNSVKHYGYRASDGNLYKLQRRLR